MATMNEIDRTKIIGGSDIAAVMGLNRWQTPLGLWAEKLGKVPGFQGNEAAELGSKLEDFVAKLFTEKTTMKVRRDGRTFTHPQFPYMVAHIDRAIVETDLILECKTCGAWKAKEWEGEEVPIEYILQCQWYMGIVGLVRRRPVTDCWLSVLIGGQRHIIKSLPFDQETFDKEVEAAKDFWENYVLKGEPPMAIAGDSDTLLAMFPEVKREAFVEIRDQKSLDLLNTAIERRNEIKAEQIEVEKELDEIEAKLKQVVGDAPGVVTDRFKVTWTPQTSRRADPAKMKEAGIFDQYSKETSTRVLRIGKTKKGE